MKRRTLARLVFLLVILGVGIGGHAYLAQALAIAPAWPAPVRATLLAAIGAGLVATLARIFLRSRSDVVVSRALSWGAYIWLGCAFLLLTTTLATSAVFALLGAASPEPLDATLVARSRAFVVGGAALALTVSGLRQGLRLPSVKRVEIALARWPAELDGFRIVQISDVHIGPLLDGRFASEVAARVNALAPDLIAVTGDLVDGRVERIAGEVEPLRALRARHGVFFVTGNHDFYSGADPWVAHLEGYGWRALRNECAAIEHAGAGFDLAGVDDVHGRLVEPGAGEDLERALADRDPLRAVVLLAHDPSTFHRASQRGVDLQISGHTHGGQIWPFRYLVRLSVPWVAGLYRRGASALYVSRGTGFWGPPMRIAAPAEITEITLRRQLGAGPQV